MKNYVNCRKLLRENSGTFSLVLERPFTPFPIHQLHLLSDLDLAFNRGRGPVSTWNRTLVASDLKTSSGGIGNSGFVTFSSKFLSPLGWKSLDDQNGSVQSAAGSRAQLPISPIICIFSEVGSGDGEWAHGNFPLDEYMKALDRSKDELYYNHALGMRYSKVLLNCCSLFCIRFSYYED